MPKKSRKGVKGFTKNSPNSRGRKNPGFCWVRNRNRESFRSPSTTETIETLPGERLPQTPARNSFAQIPSSHIVLFPTTAVATGVQCPLVDESSANANKPDDKVTLSLSRAEFDKYNEYVQGNAIERRITLTSPCMEQIG
jgi:hypothetical protein